MFYRGILMSKKIREDARKSYAMIAAALVSTLRDTPPFEETDVGKLVKENEEYEAALKACLNFFSKDYHCIRPFDMGSKVRLVNAHAAVIKTVGGGSDAYEKWVTENSKKARVKVANSKA